MRRFLDPRISNYSYRPLMDLRRHGISYPFQVGSGKDGDEFIHFMGSEAGARAVAKKLEGTPGLSLGKLFMVYDTNTPVPLSEAGAVYLDAAQADALAAKLERRTASQRELAFA